MKKIILPLLFIASSTGKSQVGIGTTNPHSYHILEIQSPDSNFLLPRVNLPSTIDIVTIPSPEEGLMIYNLNANCDLVSGLYIFDGSNWGRVSNKDKILFTRLIRDEIGNGKKIKLIN